MEYRSAAQGQPGHDEVLGLVELFREAVLKSGLPLDDPQTNLFAATAASYFAGFQFGPLEAMGIVKSADQRRFVETAASNIRQGIKVGRDASIRAEREFFGNGVQ
jgi:hypothetical protein